MAAVVDELKSIAMELGGGASAALPSALFFSALFGLFACTAPKQLNLDGPTTAYWASSCVSTVHSFIIVPLAYNAFHPLWASDDLTLTTEASSNVITVFVGYILADSVPLLWNRKTWSGTTIYLWHHGTAFLCWCLMGTRGHGHAVAVGLLLCEATAPFVNGRWFLTMFKQRTGLIYNLNGALMAASFFALRIVWMGYLLLRYVVYQRAQCLTLPTSTIALVFFGIVVGYPMQMLWFKKILAGLIKVLRGSSATGKKEDDKKKLPQKMASAPKKASRVEAFPVGASDAADRKKVR